jgi:hypothetical protein
MSLKRLGATIWRRASFARDSATSFFGTSAHEPPGVSDAKMSLPNEEEDSMKLVALLTVATITAATSAVLTTKLLRPARPTMAPQSATVFIDELHGQIDLASLPESKFDDLV